MTDPATLRNLAADLGADVTLDAATRLLAYLDAMLEENRNVNLTAVRDREEAVLFHALDSLAFGCGSRAAPPKRALDLGTGNGFPGVAVLCVYPRVRVVLMDRTLKKLKAIERALRASELWSERVETLQMDAREAPAHGFERDFDLITARAVAPPAELAVLAKPLLSRGGRLLCWLGGETEAPPQLKGALKRLEAIEYTLPEPAGRQRRLVHYGRG
ncbi:MAG: RsmG family class I SAM-dependent methyltransferase [Planctomycetota bacterium]